MVETFKRNMGIELIHVTAGAALLREAGRRRRARGASARSSASCSCASSRSTPAASATPSTWCRARCTPTSSRAAAATARPSVIKSHHNVGGLPEDMTLKLVEPLRDLFKDEVRRLGKELGLPDEIVLRQPFPGPGPRRAHHRRGHARTGGHAAARRRHRARGDPQGRPRARAVAELRRAAADIRSVGVMGDERTYAHPIIIRAVTSDDAMTADWARLPYDLLETMSNRIINEVAGVNRVVYDITSKPPGTIEWE